MIACGVLKVREGITAMNADLCLINMPVLTGVYWEITVNRADNRLLDMYERHYSCYQYKDGRERRQGVSPGQYLALMTARLDALFVWHKSKFRRDGQIGINCAVFRNESTVLSSLLIEEAAEIAWRRWAGERLFTYVNPAKIRSVNPGYCFKMAGWTLTGESKTGLLLFELHQNNLPLTGY